MTNFEKLQYMESEQNGMLQLADAAKCGISKPVFYQYIKEHQLYRVAPGIYLSEDAWVDSMYLLHLRFKQAVFSHETALFLHDLTDREPLFYTLTLKTGYNPRDIKKEGVQVFTIKQELMEIGVTTARTPFGHTVPVYNMERTVCDLLRSRSQIEIQTMQTALKQYVARKDKNLRVLMRYAKQFHVEKILRQYMEASQLL